MKKVFFNSLTWISRFLPPWRDTATIDVIPRIEWIRVKSPVNRQKLPEAFANQFIRAKSIPPRRIFLLNNVCVTSRGVVFSNLRIFIPSLPWIRDLEMYRKGWLLFSQWRKSTKKVDTPNVVLIYDHWGMCNYYHWMVESLQRLYIVGQMYPDCTIVLPESVHEYVHRSIALMGFNKFLTIKSDEVVNVPSLIMPEIVYYDGVENEEHPPLDLVPPTHPLAQQELIISVRKKLLESLKPVHAYRKIYVSRSRAKIRRLKNESEILSLLEKEGFETVYFEGMSFMDQVQLMRETLILAGVHGSNMVNILFLPETATVLELMNEHYLNDAFYLLSSSVGVSYYSVPCKMVNEELKTSNDPVAINDADLVVDPELFRQTLENILVHETIAEVAHEPGSHQS
jgi:hypothetical protein